MQPGNAAGWTSLRSAGPPLRNRIAPPAFYLWSFHPTPSFHSIAHPPYEPVPYFSITMLAAACSVLFAALERYRSVTDDDGQRDGGFCQGVQPLGQSLVSTANWLQ